ncbi:unnamed protein product [Urochloa decumbens]|uniref:DUF1618 domain-containing protein n=1 Tax=Urochloa decumbens TaxID=240449 RepID=A0ABC9DAN0_9POAL
MADEKSTNPSLRPPLHGYHDGDGDGSSSWVLLDLYPYIADRKNSTSASAMMRGGDKIRVTLCAAPPPLVSYVCVWCPGLPASEIYKATLEAAESDLLLVRVTLVSRDPHGEFFVYKASSKGACPLLRPLHVPLDCLRRRNHIGLLAHTDVAGALPRGEDDDAGIRSHGPGGGVRLHPYRDGDAIRFRPHDEGLDHYFVAALCYKTCTDETSTTTFNLWVYNSTDDKWTASPISLHGTPPPRQLDRAGTRCYLPVPEQISWYTRCPDEAQLARDAVLVDGRLTLVDLCYLDATCSTWEVSAWSKGVFSSDEGWCHDYEVLSRDILIDGDTENASLLPRIKDGQGAVRPTLEGLHIAHPVLSLTASHVVYIMAKVGIDDTKALLLSVDMRNKKQQAVSMFDGERMFGMFSYTCTQSRIPGYFNPAV